MTGIHLLLVRVSGNQRELGGREQNLRKAYSVLLLSDPNLTSVQFLLQLKLYTQKDFTWIIQETRNKNYELSCSLIGHRHE